MAEQEKIILSLLNRREVLYERKEKENRFYCCVYK